jgi:DNA-binding MarR family transcriptional regulator/N-acetylglutamate synthase-like GNAT family acetyltransferase
MPEDLVSELGMLAFGSRLKRFADKLIIDGIEIYKSKGHSFKPYWFPTFYLLSTRGPASLGEVSKALRVSHPAINQIAAEMHKNGLLTSGKDNKDSRRRILKLTPKGQKLATELQPIWANIRTALQTLADDAGVDAIAMMTKLETSFHDKSFKERFDEAAADPIEIVEYTPELKEHFLSINRQWIEELFQMESIDWEVLQNPEEHILNVGGSIFFAKDKPTGQIVGTCALMPHHDGIFELNKMGVRPEARGKRAGFKMGQAIVQRAREMGLKQIILHTNSGLAPAIRVYEQLGFKRIPLTTPAPHVRADVRMVLEL